MRSDSAIRAWLQTTTGIVAVTPCRSVSYGGFAGVLLRPQSTTLTRLCLTSRKVVSSGSWIRSLHHYGSQWLTVFIFIHVIRLFLSDAYATNRIQWIAAILILGLVMAAGGTGYSLPWDARAFFSTRVAEGLMGGLPFAGRLARLWVLGGSEISSITLSRFFALHVLVIPALIGGVVVWRLLRSNIAGGIADWLTTRCDRRGFGVYRTRALGVEKSCAAWSGSH